MQDFIGNLETSLASARERYGVSETELSEFASRLLISLESDSFGGLPLALDVVGRLGLAKEAVTGIEDRALRNPGSDSGIRVLALANRMRQVSQDLDSALRSVSHGG